MKKQNLKPAVCIFSVDKYYRTDDRNHEYRRWVVRQLERNDIPYKIVSGKYTGIAEVSYVVLAKYLDYVEQFTYESDQDGFLFVHPDRTVDLIDVDGGAEEIGRLVPAHKKPKGDYTLDSGQYYEVI